MKPKKPTAKEEVTNGQQETGTTEDHQESQAAGTEAPAGEKTDEKAVLAAKVEELNDKYLRLYSEFDNFRKRTFREKVEMSKTASEELVVDLLPVLDDFERAMKSFEITDNHEALREGVQLILSKFRNVLTGKGLQEIKSLGEPFDTDFHEAVTHFPVTAEEKKNTVIDEVQKGYKMHDKVIRFAKVVVGS